MSVACCQKHEQITDASAKSLALIWWHFMETRVGLSRFRVGANDQRVGSRNLVEHYRTMTGRCFVFS